MKKEVKSKLNQIGEELKSCSPENTNLGLLSGITGIAIFYSELFKLTQDDEHLFKCHELITTSVEQLAKSGTGYSFSNGCAGIGWAINWLVQNDFMEPSDDLFNVLEDQMYELGCNEIKKGRYDFLHGAGGVAVFALARCDKKAVNFLKYFVAAIDKVKQTDDFGIKWEDLISEKKDEKPIFGLGLAHGMPSIVMILLKIYKQGILQSQTKNLINESLQWILHCRFEKINTSIYPNKIHLDKQDGPSRLSWCYGDLGLATTFWNVGTTFKNKAWIRESNELIINSLTRFDSLDSSILDAGFCHGTSGVAFLFKTLGNLTGINDCKRIYEFWISETLKLAKDDTPLSGYKFYYPMENEKWVNRNGILEGIAGVGLVLLDYLAESPSPLNQALLIES